MKTSCEGIEDCRTIWTIVWSCLVTLAACTWVAVHLNVPSPNEGLVDRTLRRIGIMLIAVVAPEFVVGWAARQYMVAGRLAKDCEEDYAWTRTHGFFALMGGFMLYDGDEPIRTLTPADLETLSEDGSIDFPRITKEEIEDRSKGDALSKGIALIHTTWFTIQVIARGLRRLPITELEVATLAFTVLNVATYSLWWSKPLSVQRPVRVPLKRGKGIPPRSDPDSTSPVKALVQLVVVCVIIAGFTGVGYGVHFLAKRKHGNMRAVDDALVIILFLASIFAFLAIGIIVVIIAVLAAFLFAAAMAYAQMIMGFIGTMVGFFGMGLGYTHDRNALKVSTLKVSTFYDGSLNPQEQRKFQTFILPTIAVAFGSIHSIAWQYDFPTHLEQKLWRMATVTITCSPVVMTMASGWAHSSGQRMGVNLDRNEPFLFKVFMIFALLVFVFYLVSRITLLAIAFSSLRSLPSGAFEVISWTSYIPHL
ncbi:hypothetical protein JAAARDRAFT_632028 [Jaapia argillacea MUCL 33604]|uniref:Uncharacterized protein n=1 Tax=Jaapia argillacea MUCL 33604 TaxID=933084 RepID=A0A067PY77_9AGAM|nr:hypothetical protein JAAARDRAFT_632028 [Jaapia argillacea MUCL 33604]